MVKRKIIKTDGLENSQVGENNNVNNNMDNENNNQNHNVGKEDKNKEEFKKMFMELIKKVSYSEDYVNIIYDDIFKKKIKEQMDYYIRTEGQKKIEDVLKNINFERDKIVCENELKKSKYVNFEVNFNINFNGYKIDNIIAEMRKQYHLNQNELSKMMNVSRPTVSSIENNENNISLENAFKLSKIFGKSIEELFSYDKDNKYDNDNNDNKCNIYDK